MSYKIVQSDGGKYVELVYEGEFTLAELEKSRNEGHEILVRNGWSRVLVNVTIASAYPATVDYFDFASKLGDFTRRDIRIAIIVREERKELGRFVENVAVNRGMDVRCFTGREAAVQWLLEARSSD